MQCKFCGGRTVKKRVTMQHWLDGKLYLVENVEADVCRECGERYYHAKTLDAVDAMLRGEHQVKERLTVEVVRL